MLAYSRDALPGVEQDGSKPVIVEQAHSQLASVGPIEIESDMVRAIRGLASTITEDWDVPLGVVRGYCSQTFAHDAVCAIGAVKATCVHQLGDHDPSGVGAWNDFKDRVSGFVPYAEVYFERIAVTADQIEEMGLPTRPTKRSDSRAGSFLGRSVEVDAIPAPISHRLVAAAIEQQVDAAAFERTKAYEAHERETLYALAVQASGAGQ